MKIHRVAALLALTLLALTLLAPVSQAQEKDDRIPVRITASCSKDQVGERLVYRTKEEIRKSNRMKDESDYLSSVLQVRFVCLTPDSVDSGVVSKYSYVITALNTSGTYDYYITSAVGECGSSRTSSCAEGIAADIDSALDDLIDTIKKGKLKFGS